MPPIKAVTKRAILLIPCTRLDVKGGNMNEYRRIRTGRGQANLGQGNQNIGRDQIDRRVDNRQYRHVHNQGMYAERDVHYRDGDFYDIQHGPSNAFDDIASGRGIGRFIAAVGLLIALAGFGGWMYVIFSGFAAKGSSFDPMAIEVQGYPLMVVGFVAFAVGGVIGAIGGAMAKAARRRHEREMYDRRRRGY
jgi:hypothetical protein